jgi:hypothetical protein
MTKSEELKAPQGHVELIPGYTLWHLNLDFSALPECKRGEVITKCYWPLLNIAIYEKIKINIECTVSTLNIISSIDPEFIRVLRRLIESKDIGFIGSGYVQAIGPLIPYQILTKNLAYAQIAYYEILGLKPTIYLINEQAISRSMLQVYKQQGIDHVIVDVIAAARTAVNPVEFQRSARNRVAEACDSTEKEAKIIWSDSINFQRFQRYVHGEITDAEIAEFYETILVAPSFNSLISIYSSDAEIFNFRMARHNGEQITIMSDEWSRINDLLLFLKQKHGINFVNLFDFFSSTLFATPSSYRLSDIFNQEAPVIVKKQEKYNLTRWAVTGRNDFLLNSRCWLRFKKLTETKSSESDWIELLTAWKSDFRTHIETHRWNAVLESTSVWGNQSNFFPQKTSARSKKKRSDSRPSNLTINDNRIVLSCGDLKVDLNLLRGGSFNGVTIAESGLKMLGLYPQGYKNNLLFDRDYFSGHIIMESDSLGFLTDLNRCKPVVEYKKDAVAIFIKNKMGPYDLFKRLNFYGDGLVDVQFKFCGDLPFQGVVRTVFTMDPDIFSIDDDVYYTSHFGGEPSECFKLTSAFSHSQRINSRVSSKGCIGMTEGLLDISSSTLGCRFQRIPEGAEVAMIDHNIQHNCRLLRLSFSHLETDETSKPKMLNDLTFGYQFRRLI